MMDDTLEFVCTTIEGELGPVGAGTATLHGAAARLVRRRLSPAFGDSFIRWYNLPPQAWAAALEYPVPESLLTLEPRSRRRKHEDHK